jgi:hypothetical protein
MSNTVQCTECGKELQIGDFPFCPHGRYKHKPFVPFTDISISDRPMTFESVRQHEKYMREHNLDIRPNRHLDDMNAARERLGMPPLAR